MIYGYFAYILLIGILKMLGCPPRCRELVCTWDSMQDIVIAVAMIALYTGVTYGVPREKTLVTATGEALQSDVNNTWEIDLMGWLAGTIYAAALATWLRKTRAFSKKPVRLACRARRLTLPRARHPRLCLSRARAEPSAGAHTRAADRSRARAAQGHQNKLPTSKKRFQTSAAGSAVTEMTTSRDAFHLAAPGDETPFGMGGAEPVSDNPFLAHVPPSALPPPAPAAPTELRFEHNYAPVAPPPPAVHPPPPPPHLPPPASNPGETSYV
jgi:hypothetical protein